jgi:hypothetical protein
MATDKAEIRGIVRGRIIELDQEPGLPDGQSVTVTLTANETAKEGLAPGDGIRRSAGGWSEDADDLDAYLEWNRRQRKIGRREIDA